MTRMLVLAGVVLFSINLSLSADEIESGQRTALLIGNSDYDGFKLKGVKASLDLVEESLKRRGFSIQRHENVEEKPFKELLPKFATSVPTNGVAVIYYIGLGAHVERFGKTYNVLRPVKTSIKSDNDYRGRGLNLTESLTDVREVTGARDVVVFLDACWESPILPEQGSVSAGMHEFEVPADSTVVFAAASKSVISVPERDEPSRFARAVTKHFGGLEESLKVGCAAIAKDADQCWSGGAVESGLGVQSKFPVADELRDGKSPGEAFVNSVGMSFRWCPAGSFRMGSEETETSGTRDRKAVDVTLTKGFWIGEYEVTQREYNVVARRTVPLTFTKAPNAPWWGMTEVKGISDFCKKLADIEKKAGRLPSGWEYRCPTEAQWEYACRAGSGTAYCFGDDVSELGRYGNFADKTLRTEKPDYYWADRVAEDGFAEALAPVGSYRPNAWGIRDMHGNVAEIVADHLQPELPGGTDPHVTVEKEGKTVVRGGAWCSTAEYCESSFRNHSPPRDKSNFVGFRIVLQKVK